MVRSADPHAQTVCQALSVMILIAAKKKAREDILDETLKRLNWQVDKLQMSYDMHWDDALLKELVAGTYLSTYKFAVEASYYYLSPSWKRVLKAVVEPPEIKVKKAADDLEKVMHDVRVRCSILIQRRIEHIDAKVGQIESRLQVVETHTESTHKLAEDSTRRFERKYLDALRSSVRHPGQSDDRIERYRNEMIAVFNPRLNYFASSLNGCYPLNVHHLRSTAAFQKWAGNTGSHLLLASGQTEDHQQKHCWLSSGLLEVHDECRRGGELVLLFCCRPDAYGSRKRVKIEAILRDLAYQILAAHPELLRQESIQELLPRDREGRDNHLPSMDTDYDPKRILLKLLKGRGKTWIFIDRIDCCLRGHDYLPSTLAKLMNEIEKGEGSDCLKIFLVAASDNSPEFKLFGKGEDTRKDIRDLLDDKCHFIDQTHRDYNGLHISEARQDW
ncbi:hypothetical protein F5Y13DRAFT_171034 [Hypoxylon sp. FL1857]|nr:hypothetical protein F5Y13DRAFT_171034 [Hypoxylon sp. FL1857]